MPTPHGTLLNAAVAAVSNPVNCIKCSKVLVNKRERKCPRCDSASSVHSVLALDVGLREVRGGPQLARAYVRAQQHGKQLAASPPEGKSSAGAGLTRTSSSAGSKVVWFVREIFKSRER